MAVTKSVSSGSSATSDEITPPPKAAYGRVILKADNNGTPASGDEIHWKYRIHNGDPDADPDSADEYTTSDTDRLLDICDTNSNDPSIGHGIIPGEDAQGIKLVADNQASSNAITVSAQIQWMYKDDTASTETQVDWT